MSTVTKSGVQNLRGDATSWTSKAVVTKVAEFGYDTTNDRVKIGNGTDKFDARPHFLDSDHEGYTAGLDRLYAGLDLTQRKENASEITGYTTYWDWLKARIKAADFENIHVGDLAPLPLAAGTITDGTTSYAITAKTLYAQVAGIDTYYGYGDQQVGHHIDFITTACIGTNIPWNPTDNNNGTSTYQNPWLASKIYACLNGVNNVSTGANNVVHGYDASSGGVLQLLPTALQNVIVEKRLYMPNRYNANGLNINSSSGSWCNAGKLWLPTEQEVYGHLVHSASTSKGTDGLDFAAIGTPVQYPLFAGTAGFRNNKVKSRVYWWLSSVASGSSTHACYVNSCGVAGTGGCAYAGISVPVCFRISA